MIELGLSLVLFPPEAIQPAPGDIGLAVVRIEPDRRVVVGQRALNLALVEQEAAAVHIGDGKVLVTELAGLDGLRAIANRQRWIAPTPVAALRVICPAALAERGCPNSGESREQKGESGESHRRSSGRSR